MIQRLKKAKENKKGFTLVELIVVLVILAILIALLVPALTGYIDKAREKAVLVEARNLQMGAQTAIDIGYEKAANAYTGTTYTITNGTGDGEIEKEIVSLSETKGSATITTDEKGKIVSIEYSNKGWTATYDGAEWKAAKTTTTTPTPDEGEETN